MSKVKRKSSEGFDESELFSDNDFNLYGFIESMEKEDVSRKARRRANMQKLEDWRETRWLREQLNDWDDWD